MSPPGMNHSIWEVHKDSGIAFGDQGIVSLRFGGKILARLLISARQRSEKLDILGPGERMVLQMLIKHEYRHAQRLQLGDILRLDGRDSIGHEKVRLHRNYSLIVQSRIIAHVINRSFPFFQISKIPPEDCSIGNIPDSGDATYAIGRTGCRQICNI